MKDNNFKNFIDKIIDYKNNGIPEDKLDKELGQLVNDAYHYYLKYFCFFDNDYIDNNTISNSIVEKMEQLHFKFYDGI